MEYDRRMAACLSGCHSNEEDGEWKLGETRLTLMRRELGEEQWAGGNGDSEDLICICTATLPRSSCCWQSPV